MRTVIKGTGSQLPRKRVTNDELSQTLDTNDAWIYSRTGIKARHLCADDETTSTLATSAAKKALEMAGVDAKDVGLVVVSTTTPDFAFPSTANLVQANLSIEGAMAFDVQNACNGFIIAMQTADSLMKQNNIKHAIVIGAEAFSRIMDWTDRGTAILFGDGAGAVMLSLEEGDATSESGLSGVIGGQSFSEGEAESILKSKGGPGSTGKVGAIHMNGREVFKLAVRRLCEMIPHVMTKFNIASEQIAQIIPHQANVRILETLAKAAGVSLDKFIMTLEEHANTSSASIPLALDHANREGRFKEGDVLMMIGFGAGFVWGGLFVRW